MDLLKHGIPKSKLAGSISLQAAVGSNLCDADLSNADLSGADLRRALPACLTQEQIDQAYGDEKTQLPDCLQRPESWG